MRVKMGEIGQIPNHQVKVDNWPLFFLQRLHHFYRKKSHCDLTLLFSTLDTVKSIKVPSSGAPGHQTLNFNVLYNLQVHKLVLHACTDYFESLDIMKDSEHGEVLQLSNEMHPDVVIPIISFMYTGKLEFPVTLQPRLYEAATKLRMTILTKLLDVQPGKTWEKPTQHSFEEGVKVSILQSNVPNPVENSQDDQNLSTTLNDVSLEKNATSSSSIKQVVDPNVTLSPVSTASAQQKKTVRREVTVIQKASPSFVKSKNQIKTKPPKKNTGLQLGTATSKPKAIDVNLPPTLPGRKLPVWKRKVPVTGSKTSENNQNARNTFRTIEMPKPTRFEWDEDLNDPTILRPVEDAPKILSHDAPSIITHPIILNVKATKQKDVSDDTSKKNSDGSSFESPPYKRSRSDLQDMKEYGKQQQLRNAIICNEENEENDENDENDENEENDENDDNDDMMDADDLYGTCDDEPEDVSNFTQSNVNCSTPKPILKTVPRPEPPVSPKRVRFSLEGKENNQIQNETSGDFTMTKQPEAPIAKQKIVLPMDVNQIQSGKHHVKIVSEVLKKYPNLAKRENIKLRVISKNPAAVPPTVQKAVEGETGTASKSATSLVSYIFLTNKSSGDIISIKNDSNEKEKEFDVENKTGPWFCHVCNEAEPLEFDSYYTYRRHLVEVHELKIDARICEYCGLKNSKRNHLLYHLYTKHGINPPAHMSFPKCSECDYIALSDSLLLKHKNIHDPKGLMCYTCNVVFKTFSSMQCHLNSDCHNQRVPTKEEYKQIYRCPYCESIFGNADFLGRHIVSVHWGKTGKIVFKEQGMKMEMCQPQSGQQLQYGTEVQVTEKGESTENKPPCELESLSNVASNIASSLSLTGNEQTVLYYQQKAEEHEIGREATIVSEGECKEYIITGPLENITSQHSEKVNDIIEGINVENDDSNSRTSNMEEVNPTSCSDHDYSEPHIEDNYRQVIPVQTVDNQMAGSSVIQQIVQDQRLVFANEGNVVFPQRVLLTGKVVLPTGSGDQNVILSQVIPQTRIILSSSILQQPGNIINEGNGAIVFANPEGSQMENVQTFHYEIRTPENVESEDHEKQRNQQKEKIHDQVKMCENREKKSNANDLDTGDVRNLNMRTVLEDNKITSRIETSKIVDDWDEMNESSNNVESRGDGPSRPEFF